MRFRIEFTSSAERDIDYFRKGEQKIIFSGIREYLSEDATIETKRKKQLRPNPLAPWELRIGDYRVFYEVETDELQRLA
jgi:mRNA-degrading endonuclease RelE of RelBE toxin-antitoxin system